MRYESLPTKQAALDRSNAIMSRAPGWHPTRSTAQYYYGVDEDEDTGEAVLLVDAQDVRYLDQAEQAALKREAELSPDLQDLLWLRNLRERVKAAPDGRAIMLHVDRIGLEKLRALMREARDDAQLRVEIRDKLNSAERIRWEARRTEAEQLQ